MAALVSNGTQLLLRQQSGIIGVACLRAFSSEENAYNLATLKRGTGGRSSFNGIVATVFGATGFMGRYVCNKLGKVGSQLIIPYRGDNYEPMRLKVCGDLGQVYFHPYNLKDEDSIRKVIKYSNVVINLVGRDWETKNFKFNDVHVEGCKRLARLAKEAGVKRFIHLSALNAEEHPEEFLIKGGSKFLQSKFRGEQAVLQEFPEATIIRPADVYGQEDRFLRFYVHFWRLQGQYMPIWRKGEATIKQPVHVSDVSNAIYNAIKDPDSAGQIYQAVGPKRYYLSELVDYFYRIIKKDEEWGYKRYDLRYDPLFKLKITLNEKLSMSFPPGNVHWERFERECVTDQVDSRIPTLEDLGINLTCVEEQVPWELKPWTYAIYSSFEEDVPHAPVAPPKVAV